MNGDREVYPGPKERLKRSARATALLGAALIPAASIVVTPVEAKNTPPVIALDSGHGPNSSVIDAQTGLNQVEGLNEPETDVVWAVSQMVKRRLLEDGYKVVMLKRNRLEKVTFRQRAQRADNAHADLAVSIHEDPNLPNTGQIFDQRVGLYRGAGANKTVFSDVRLASLSHKYSLIIQKERQKIEGSDIVVKVNNFTGRAGLEPGDEPMVQLFTKKTPWVYNEKKMLLPISVVDESKYATGIAVGIEKAIPIKK